MKELNQELQAAPAEHSTVPEVVTVPKFIMVGIRIHANLKEIEEQQLGRKAYEAMLERKHEIVGRTSEHLRLVQKYPMKPNFNPHVDAFSQLIGFVVPENTTVPEGMALREFPERQYVRMTHVGPEAELGRTYDYLYGQWMRENGRQPAGYDYEVWDERYKPDQADNEMDVYIALA